jgi:hypothetical protein
MGVGRIAEMRDRMWEANTDFSRRVHLCPHYEILFTKPNKE